MTKIRWTAIALTMSLVAAGVAPAGAAENGVGFYLLGSRGPMAGFIPPPGVYFQNDAYYYNGNASASRSLPFNGQIVAGVDARIWVEMPTLLWSTPVQILGGNLAFSVTQPIGGPSIDVGARLTGPLGNTIATGLHDSVFTIGDPVLAAMVGWHHGNFHWQTGVMVNTPIGDYREGALANIAFHRWGSDVYGAFTWLDPKIGLDLSLAAGVTFNGTNDFTQYRTGNEFHLEWAAEQHFSKQFSMGLIGYYYQQITGDSGLGATLGPFKGNVVALGGTMGFNFDVGQLPWSVRLKVYKEVHVENRLEGAGGFLTLAVPLYVAKANAPAK
ncbi:MULTISPECIES: SphA family protein [unclassified Bradyrhizobium]|uniref:SphA family protein n=1 Tax=unclassified Bradyrhizobium TaxID=2631580 RepID=UPI002FF06389